MPIDEAHRFIDRAKSDNRVRLALSQYTDSGDIFPIMDLSRETGDFFSKTEFMEAYQARFPSRPAEPRAEADIPASDALPEPVNDAERFLRLAATDSQVRYALQQFNATYNIDPVLLAAKRVGLRFSSAEFINARAANPTTSHLTPIGPPEPLKQPSFNPHVIGFLLHPANEKYLHGERENPILRHSGTNTWIQMTLAGMMAVFAVSSLLGTGGTWTGLLAFLFWGGIGLGIALSASNEQDQNAIYGNQGVLVEGHVSATESRLDTSGRRWKHVTGITVAFDNPQFPQVVVQTIETEGLNLALRMPTYATKVAIYYVDEKHWWLL